MHKLLQRQLKRATSEFGKVDLDLLLDLVAAAYAETDRDRRRIDRTISLMSDELQRAHRRLLEAFDIVPEGLVLLDADERYVLFNRRYLELCDTARDKIEVGASFRDSVRAAVERGHYLDAVGREESWLDERFSQLGSGVLMDQHLRGDRWVRVDERRTADGGIIGARIDITDLKRREAALQQRSEQLIEAQRLGKMADWSLGLTATEHWWSAQLYELLRYDPALFRPTREAVRAICEPSDLEAMVTGREEILRSGTPFTVDLKVRRGDKSTGNFAVTSKAVFDQQGRVVGLSGTIQDISERKSAEEKLERLAYYDPLTGLGNRVLLLRDLDNLLTRSRKAGFEAALLFIDLDGFKDVNDSLGHASGDDLLAKVARRISRVLSHNHMFSQLGGDEFAILVEQCGDRLEVERFANAVIDAVSGAILLDGGEVTVGISIGITLIPADGSDATDIQRNCDLALYFAKENGRGCYRFFDPVLSAASRHRIALARELRRAVSEGRGLEVHYQPQISLQSGRVVGFEALARWSHHEFGSVPPSQFIPIAETSQLICDLGIWVLRQAANQAKAWIDSGEPIREISVNVSAAQIWQSDFVDEVAAVLRESGLPPHLLCLELTESLLAGQVEGRVRSVLRGLKELGVSLAIDDFGTDYSSLGYLTQLPFDRIKIDKVFVKSIETSARARRLLTGIIALCRGLGLTVVAEGAETRGQAEIIHAFDCDVVQGFYFGRPEAAGAAARLARDFDATRSDLATDGDLPERRAPGANLTAAA